MNFALQLQGQGKTALGSYMLQGVSRTGNTALGFIHAAVCITDRETTLDSYMHQSASGPGKTALGPPMLQCVQGQGKLH